MGESIRLQADGVEVEFIPGTPTPREGAPRREPADPPPPRPRTLMPVWVEDASFKKGGYWRNNGFDLEEVLDLEDRGDFAFVGWSYEKTASKTLVCTKCGGDRFIVGAEGDARLTVIKCPTCGYERCIHEG